MNKVGKESKQERQVRHEEVHKVITRAGERIAILRLSNCEKCPNLKMSHVYTADSFEDVTGWYCKGLKDRLIAELDWNDKKPDIPKWCPLIVK